MVRGVRHEACCLYLGSSFQIDIIGRLIKNLRMFYLYWKYYHSSVLHGKALAVVVTFDLYQECESGSLLKELKVEKYMGFYKFG